MKKGILIAKWTHQKGDNCSFVWQEIETSAIRLYPDPDLEEIASLRAKAQEELSGFTTGLGFLGSPGWVIGSAAVLGVMESIVSDSKAKQGLLLLKEAAEKYKALQQKGVLLDVSKIEGIDNPDPTNWHANTTCIVNLDLKDMSDSEKTVFYNERDMDMHQRMQFRRETDGLVTEEVETSFSHDGSDFVWIDIDGQLTALRWEYVETYRAH